MKQIPSQLVSTKEKNSKIGKSISKNCMLLRRTNLEEYMTPYDELDVELIRDIDLFRMSTNVFLCKREEVGLDNQIKHANIVIIHGENTKFTGDNVLSKEQLKKIVVEQKETLILGFQIGDIENIKGPYVMGLGTKKEQSFNYGIVVTYDPLVLNCYHMESVIVCSETNIEISRSKIKGFRKAIASDIKVKLMNKKKVEIFNYEEIA